MNQNQTDKTNICKICSCETRKIISLKFNIEYNYCDNCEFISKDEKYVITSAEELRIYNNHNNSIEDLKYVEYFNKFIITSILPYITKGKVLDFGSGPVPVFSILLERDYKFKVDIYDYFYQPDKVYVDKKYDLITSTEVIEHLKNPIEYFSLFKNLLVENGYLSIMTLFHPNNDFEFLNWHYMRDMSHISFYTPKTMRFIADAIGFEIIFCDSHRCVTFIKK